MRDPHTPELFAERPVRSDFGRSKSKLKLRPVLIGVGVLAVLGGGAVWWGSGGSDQPTEIPTIAAEGPTKQRPEQPGGIDIPHQDETVFQQLDNSGVGKQPAVEHLLPPPEAPQAAAAQAPVEPIQPTTIEKPIAAQPVPVPVAAAPVPSVTPEPQVPKPQAVATTPAAAAQPLPSNAAPAQPAVTKPAAPKPMIVGHLPEDLFRESSGGRKGFLVQLASFPDPKIAEAQMQKIQAKHGAALGDLRLRLVRADLGAKGTYYRVQTPSLTDAQARNLCAALLEKKAACMIVRP